MDDQSAKEIAIKVQAELADTPYACSSLDILSGGTANFLYKGTLTKPLEDGTTHVVVKHAEAFVKNNPAFPLSTARCHFEETALEQVQAGLGPVSEGIFTVKTPKCFNYNPETNTQVQEYAPGTLDLKNYALKFWSPSSSSPSSPSPSDSDTKSQCQTLGRGLGSWLRKFHDWSELPEQAELRETVKGNAEMQKLKHMLNYPNSLQTAKKYPDILGESEGILREVADMALKELEEGAEGKMGGYGVIHGDFWTGNALVPSKQFEEEGEGVKVDIIDWELVQMGHRAVDLGQMTAELLELKLFKNIDAGVWLIEGLADGYGAVEDEFAFRVAIHAGAHLVNWSGIPDWGSEEQVHGVVAKGRDIIVNAWKKDRSWFERMELGCLFGST